MGFPSEHSENYHHHFPLLLNITAPETGLALTKAPISIYFQVSSWKKQKKKEFGVFNQIVIFKPRLCCLCVPALTRETGAQWGLFMSYTGICHLLFSNLKLLRKKKKKTFQSCSFYQVPTVDLHQVMSHNDTWFIFQFGKTKHWPF